jgi:septum formation protein
LILASASPQRRKLLKRLRRPFRVLPSRVSERSSEKNPRKLVILLAKRKALEIAKRRPADVVLAADTLVVCAGRIIGKPRDARDAFRILSLLSGRWQRVYTGVAVATDGGKRMRATAVLSRVKCRKLSEGRLRSFAAKHLDKAGAYAVQDRSDPFVERVVGPLDNVIGLPVDAVRALLRRPA